MIVLGLHGGATALQHDISAALVIDGEIVACAEEERFSRIKKAAGSIPISAISAVLKEAGITINDVDKVAHPGETYKDLSDRIRLYLEHYFGHAPEIHLVDHQTTHIASAYYCSNFDSAMVISYDGFGDNKSLAMGSATPDGIKITHTRGLDQSLGNLYGAITSFLGFKTNEDEFKVMGLAPYGEPGISLDEIIKITHDDYEILTPVWERDPQPMSHYEPWFGEEMVRILGQPRHKSDELTQRHKDIAFAIQDAHERAIIALATRLHEETGLRKLCLAGGCALNCSANGKLAQLPFVDEIFVQPAAGDQGTALGAAQFVANAHGDNCSKLLSSVSLGPSQSLEAMRDAFALSGMDFSEPEDATAVAAQFLADGKIIGWFQGRSEFGPRALGNRSILAHPGLPHMKDLINGRIKFREEFRPFAPAVLEENASEVFEMSGASPFMTVAYPVREDWKPRLPAITHANGTGRVQTVSSSANRPFHELISKFSELTDIPVLLNTSFNVKGQPIVETPLDALGTFAATGMDALVIGPFVVTKPNPPAV